MTIKRILLLVSGSAESKSAAEAVIPLAKALNAQIVAFNVVDVSVARRMRHASGKHEHEILVELEETGWKYLYMVEEMAKDEGVKIVLQQMEGFPEAKVFEAARKFEADIVALPGSSGGKRGGAMDVARFVGRAFRELKLPVLIV